MRVLVCGGRDYGVQPWQSVSDTLFGDTPDTVPVGCWRREREVLEQTMQQMKDAGMTLLIHGDARGADRLAGDWAERNGVHQLAFPAQWERYGKQAGLIRNMRMLDEKPAIVIAFPGGRGTADMVRRAEAAGVSVRKITV